MSVGVSAYGLSLSASHGSPPLANSIHLCLAVAAKTDLCALGEKYPVLLPLGAKPLVIFMLCGPKDKEAVLQCALDIRLMV